MDCSVRVFCDHSKTCEIEHELECGLREQVKTRSTIRLGRMYGTIAAADERLEVMRTLTNIDSHLIIKHESPVMINELKLNQFQTLRGEPRTRLDRCGGSYSSTGK